MAFKINGLDASLSSSPITLQPLASTEVQLIGATSVPGVTLAAPTNVTAANGGPVFIVLEVTNTGSVTGLFSVDALLTQPWVIDFQPPGSNALRLDAGESAIVVARIEIPLGTPNSVVELSSFATSDTCAQANSGVWTELSVSTITTIKDADELVPNSFYLAQNYPNPFNGSTNISFSLEHGGQVQLSICNLIGQTVKTLVSGFRETGNYNEAWDGRDDRSIAVPSGIYFSRLVQHEQSMVRKLVLLK